jgi:ABC-2 type transport system permease protein
MNTPELTLIQMRYVNKGFWRNPASAFFSFAFPLIFLVIFTELLGHGTVPEGGRLINEATYYVAAMATFGVITACFNNIALSVTALRDAGILKRTNGTPLPASAYLGARILHATLVAVLLVAITVAFGRLCYGSDVPTGLTLARFAATLAIGAASFCALGLAITALIPNPDAAPAIVNVAVLPLMFLSGIFIPMGDNSPAWIMWIARIFPVRHFAEAMQAGFLGTAFDWVDIAIIAAWGLAGLLAATRYFRWEPRHGS